MRKISKEIAQAFIDKRPLKIDNSQVTIDGNGSPRLLLHGHCIARYNIFDSKILMLNLCGYPTRTTFERLNTLISMLGIKSTGFYTRKFVPMYNGNVAPIDDYIHIDLGVLIIPEESKAKRFKDWSTKVAV